MARLTTILSGISFSFIFVFARETYWARSVRSVRDRPYFRDMLISTGHFNCELSHPWRNLHRQPEHLTAASIQTHHGPLERTFSGGKLALPRT